MGKEKTLGELIDELFSVRESIRALNAQVKDLEETKQRVELALMEEMKKQNVEQSRGVKASATLTKAVVPQVQDWDKLYQFILKTKSPYLLEKRVSASVYREVLETRKNKTIPGVDSYTRESISLRTVN